MHYTFLERMHNLKYNIQINFKRKMNYIHIVLSVTSYRQHILSITMMWLKVEAIKIILSDIKFYSVKNRTSSIHIKITFNSLFLKKQVQEMMHENEQVPDIEKLEQWEFNLDTEEQERAQAKAEEEVARV